MLNAVGEGNDRSITRGISAGSGCTRFSAGSGGCGFSSGSGWSGFSSGFGGSAVTCSSSSPMCGVVISEEMPTLPLLFM